jgi:signal transduction histidine kinase
MGQGAASRRKNYYIDKDFQSKFILKFCGLVTLGSVLIIAGLYILAQVATTVSIVNARVVVTSAADFILPLLVQTVLVVTLIVGGAAAAITLFVSHKIAGPLFRFRQICKELASGNFTNQVCLRKGDQLHAFAGEFNDMIAAVRNHVKTMETHLDALNQELAAMGSEPIPEDKRQHFVAMQNKVMALQNTIKFFRI